MIKPGPMVESVWADVCANLDLVVVRAPNDVALETAHKVVEGARRVWPSLHPVDKYQLTIYLTAKLGWDERMYMLIRELVKLANE